MKELALTLKLHSIPPVLLRDRQALILLVNNKGNFILGRKNHYPTNISRLIGGGIEKLEDPQAGAAREIQEEVGITISPSDLQPMAHIRASIFLENPDSPLAAFEETSSNQPIAFETFLYALNVGDTELLPDSDLDTLTELNEAEFRDLISRYTQLEQTIEPPATFSWHDYGQFFVLVHEIALAEYRQLQAK